MVQIMLQLLLTLLLACMMVLEVIIPVKVITDCFVNSLLLKISIFVIINMIKIRCIYQLKMLTNVYMP